MVSSVVTGSELGELGAQHFSALTGPELDTPGTGLYGDQVLKTAREAGPTVKFDAGLKMPEQMSSGSGSCPAWLPALQRNTRAVPGLFVQGEVLRLHHFLGIPEVYKVIVSL